MLHWKLPKIGQTLLSAASLSDLLHFEEGEKEVGIQTCNLFSDSGMKLNSRPAKTDPTKDQISDAMNTLRRLTILITATLLTTVELFIFMLHWNKHKHKHKFYRGILDSHWKPIMSTRKFSKRRKSCRLHFFGVVTGKKTDLNAGRSSYWTEWPPCYFARWLQTSQQE